MGRRDIAEFLLEHGARLDLFAAAMLGQLEIVKAALTAFPDAHRVRGPHGIPLLAHARAGGASEVVGVSRIAGVHRAQGLRHRRCQILLDEHGHTAAHRAGKRGLDEAPELLRRILGRP